MIHFNVFLCNFKSFVSPLLHASLITKLSNSLIIAKRKEEIKSPYLIHSELIFKDLVGDPLMMMDMESIMTHHKIYFVILSPQPNRLSMYWNKHHLNES